MDAKDVFPISSIITDNGFGYPWTKTVGGKWTRGDGKYLTWEEVIAWHQAAVDDPNDDTTEPFTPVLMVPQRQAPQWTAGEQVTIDRICVALENVIWRNGDIRAFDIADALLPLFAAERETAVLDYLLHKETPRMLIEFTNQQIFDNVIAIAKTQARAEGWYRALGDLGVDQSLLNIRNPYEQ